MILAKCGQSGQDGKNILVEKWFLESSQKGNVNMKSKYDIISLQHKRIVSTEM